MKARNVSAQCVLFCNIMRGKYCGDLLWLDGQCSQQTEIAAQFLSSGNALALGTFQRFYGHGSQDVLVKVRNSPPASSNICHETTQCWMSDTDELSCIDAMVTTPNKVHPAFPLMCFHALCCCNRISGYIIH